MPTVKRILLAAVLLLLAAAPARARLISVTTPINQTTNVGQQIISFAQQVPLPPNPFNPSSTSGYIEEYTVVQSTDTSRGIYASIGSINVPFGSRGYSIEFAGNMTGTFVDPILALYGYPGDTVTCWWFGPGTAQATAHGQPYLEIYNDNASGRAANGTHTGWPRGDWDVEANWAGSSLIDTVEAPYLTLQADSTWNSMFTTTRRNCWGDFPAANGAGNVSSTSYLTYYVTADGVTHSSTFASPTYLDPAFVNYAGTSIPGCSFAVSTFSYAGFTYSKITTYGGQ